MHVLMTTDTVGGVWTYTQDLVRELLSAGYRITLVTLGRALSPVQQSWTVSTASDAGDSFACIETAYKLEWMAGCEQDIDASSTFLAELIAHCKPDLLHSNQFAYGALTTELPKLVVAHSDVISWMSAVYKCDAPDPEWVPSYKQSVSDGLRQADAVVAPSHWMASELNRIYGPLPHVQVIVNGRNSDGFSAGASKRLRALSVGRLWDKGKNVALLNKVRSRMPIWVMGETSSPDGEGLKRWSGSVHYLPSTGEAAVQELMRDSAVYVITSIYEPFGLAPVEAALSGCAIICSDIPSLREVWGNAALYYPPDDAAALSALLDYLVDGPHLIREYAYRAKERAVSDFSATRMAAEYMRLYDELVKGHRIENETAPQDRSLCALSAL